jgi:hypothetical protein
MYRSKRPEKFLEFHQENVLKEDEGTRRKNVVHALSLHFVPSLQHTHIAWWPQCRSNGYIEFERWERLFFVCYKNRFLESLELLTFEQMRLLIPSLIISQVLAAAAAPTKAQ